MLKIQTDSDIDYQEQELRPHKTAPPCPVSMTQASSTCDPLATYESFHGRILGVNLLELLESLSLSSLLQRVLVPRIESSQVKSHLGHVTLGGTWSSQAFSAHTASQCLPVAPSPASLTGS